MICGECRIPVNSGEGMATNSSKSGRAATAPGPSKPITHVPLLVKRNANHCGALTIDFIHFYSGRFCLGEFW